jgi:hypothetical protein
MKKLGGLALLIVLVAVGWFLVKGMQWAMQEEQDIGIALINLQISRQDARYDEYSKRLRRASAKSADGTIYSEQEQASFLPSYTRTATLVGEEGVQNVENRFALDLHRAELEYALLHHGAKLEAP